MEYVLGIDAGTTSFKAALFDESGRMISSSSEDYRLETPAPLLVEFSPDHYWEALKKVVRRVLDDSCVQVSAIRALAIDSQGETLICVDRHGKPLRKAIVWIDNRSGLEAEDIRNAFGIEKVAQTTGQPDVAATWPATKILWLSRNEPETFRNTFKFLLLEDYLIYRLTGQYVSEKSLLSSTLLLDIRKGVWWQDMLDYIGIGPGRLPCIHNSGESIGRLTPEAAAELGLSGRTLVVTGALDQAAGMIGSGNTQAGIITETTGSSLVVCATINGPTQLAPELKIPLQCHAIEGKYFLMLWSQTAGMVLKWFKNSFYRCELESGLVSESDIFGYIDREAEKIRAGSDGLLTLPHLSGAGCPEFNPYAKGAFFGVTLEHSRPHFARSIMESTAYMLKRNIDTLSKAGIGAGEIHALGGGAASDLWNSILADVTGLPVTADGGRESACLGSAMLAWKGAGLYASVEDAYRNLAPPKKRYKPHSANAPVYAKSYAGYLELYQRLEGMFTKESYIS